MAVVVVVGGVNVDLTVRAQVRPGGGETVVGIGPVAAAGGKGANQAVAAASVGAVVQMCASIGDDAAGGEQLASLVGAGVDVSGVKVLSGTATGMAFILLTPDGENSIVVGAGANAFLAAEDVTTISADPVQLVLAQTEPGLAPVEAAAALARHQGARFVLNAAPTSGLSQEVLAQSDPLIVNEHEAADLLREHGAGTVPVARELAGALRRHLGCPSVVVSLGAVGACIADAETDKLVDAPTVQAVDTTGAGDVLVGVTAARLAQGWDLVAATTDACAAAARAVTSEGARGYLVVSQSGQPEASSVATS